ncbi:MAG: hemin-degrading factor [Halomonadaceae bacterium]|nr:MAG: hemin-degrading factor [Halomonadaceae bacterium]
MTQANPITIIPPRSEVAPSQHITDLKLQWQALKKTQPALRIRNAADNLGVSEAELLATECGNDVMRLRPEPLNVLAELHRCGPLMALVRNHHAVHETTGTFGELRGQGSIRLFLGEQDQRLFTRGWTRAFAVQTGTERSSIQFFNPSGRACFKLFTTAETRLDVWHELVNRFASSDQSASESGIQPEMLPKTVSQLTPEQTQELRQRWAAISDVHQFRGLLKRFGLNRVSAFRHAGPDWAEELPLNAIETVITQAKDLDLSLMTFVGNPDGIQIHTGRPGRLVRTGEWFNNLSPRFSLHLNSHAIASTWLVRRPSKDGVITSLEAFDENEESILQLFGERTEGQAENTLWRKLAEELPRHAD